MTRERDIEQYLIRRVRELGGLQRKYTSPGVRGVPDRIVFMPHGRILFVELKAPGEKLRADQKREHYKIWKLGATVVTIDSKEGVDFILERMAT